MAPSVASAAVEGDLDEVVLRTIANHIGFSVGLVYGRKGKSYLLKTLAGYNNAARFAPWIVMLDLDRDFACASAGLAVWLPQRAEKMFCRIAVRAIEAWLIADRDRIAAMLGISSRRISTDHIHSMTQSVTSSIWREIPAVLRSERRSSRGQEADAQWGHPIMRK